MRPIAATLSILSLALAGSLVAPDRAAAAVVDVTTTADVVAADGECSLREAVIAANTNAAVDTCPAGGSGDLDNINLAAGHYVLEIAGAGEDAALTGDLDLLEGVGIDGPPDDPFGVMIDAAGLDRAFDVHASVGRAFFRNVTITGGAVAGEDGGAIRLADAGDLDPEGGCTDGLDIDLFRVTVRDSVADSGGGIFVGECAGVFAEFSSVVDNAAAVNGGGVAASGALTSVQLNTSTLSGNVAGTMGGGIWGEGPVIGGLFQTTAAHNQTGLGGGIALEASDFRTFTIAGSILAHNEGGDCWLETGEEANPMWSLDSDGTCGEGRGFISGTDPLLLPRDSEPLAYRLAAGSPAIDAAGDASGCGVSSFFLQDQYWNARPLDGDGDGVATCDMGSFEAPEVPFVPPPAAEPSDHPLPDTASEAPSATAPATDESPALVVVAFASAVGLIAVGRMRRRQDSNRA